MPYIPPSMRPVVDASEPMSSGELNYRITKLVWEYIKHDECYRAYNDAIGALECAKLELYRRKTALYEDKKCKQNGDVYDG